MIYITCSLPSQNKRERVRQRKKGKPNNYNNNRDIKIEMGWEVRENRSHPQDTNRKPA
jgi:hypothetical protein